MQARIRQTCLFAVIALGLVVVLAGTALAQSPGTWKLNLVKSKYNAGTAPKSSTLKYEAVGAGIKVTVDSVAADGALTHYTYTANYDGKDNPVVGNPNADMAARTRVNATTTEGVTKKAGKVMTNSTYVVSSDGKTMTITAKGTTATGQTIDSVQVYEKQ